MLNHLLNRPPQLDLQEMATQLAFERVTIIGNASGDWQPASTGTTFIFNGTQWDDKQHNAHPIINIANGGFAGSKYAFVVQGHGQNALLARALTQVATELTPALGCWPSSGLTTVVLMQQLSQALQVQRMSLLPSLQRSPALCATAHLPCMVHNWLGERRIAKGLLSAKLDWPEFTLAPVISAALPQSSVSDITLAHMPTVDPFELLETLLQYPAGTVLESSTKAIQLQSLEILAKTPSCHWQAYATPQSLRRYETLFFNHLPESEPSYWHLMDYQASQYVDAIRHHLAYCQQELAQ
jgi:hypothetical protein